MTRHEISEARNTLGLDIDEMATAMGIHRNTWGKWVKGERRPDNAAVQLVRYLLWLHGHHPRILARMLRER